MIYYFNFHLLSLCNCHILFVVSKYALDIQIRIVYNNVMRYVYDGFEMMYWDIVGMRWELDSYVMICVWMMYWDDNRYRMMLYDEMFNWFEL